MIDIKELRRLVQAATPGPWKLLPVGDKSKCFAVADINFLSVLTVVDECGTSFGAVYLDGDAKFIAAANPATVSELLDRLEAAESDALEQARLNGMGASREAALMAKLEAAEKDIALKERVIDSLGSELNAAANERDALRTELAVLRSSMTFRTSLIGRIEAERDALQAKVEAMERQEPAAIVRINAINGNPSVDFVPGHRYLHHNDKLYLAHGAQPAPIIPEGWLRAIDEALIVAHIGMANADDTYAQAKSKLDTLIGLHVDIATDPAVNGGWKLVPVEILDRFPEINQNNYNHDDVCNLNAWGVELVLAAAPEAKP